MSLISDSKCCPLLKISLAYFCWSALVELIKPYLRISENPMMAFYAQTGENFRVPGFLSVPAFFDCLGAMRRQGQDAVLSR